MKQVRQYIFAFTLAIASGSAVLISPTAVAATPIAVPTRANPSTNSATIASAATAALADLVLASSSADEAVLVRYIAERDALAALVAAGVGVDAIRMQEAWARADSTHQAALLAALTQLGVPYKKNSSSAGRGFDCSGLTSFAWKAAGVALAHQSGSQIKQVTPIKAADVQAGDLVYYPGHVSMSLGVDRTIVHAVGSGRFVEIGTTRTGKKVKFGNPAG